jgi:hypothetical protein
VIEKYLAAPQGFEPRYADPESAVLPLNEGAAKVVEDAPARDALLIVLAAQSERQWSDDGAVVPSQNQKLTASVIAHESITATVQVVKFQGGPQRATSAKAARYS